MASIRPNFNNFSSGAITPKLFGQADSAIYRTGLKKMLNMYPELFGSAKRRGGLKNIATIDPTITGKCRLIPWSINKDLDVLIVLSDRRIDLFDVSHGHAAGFISGDNLPITALAGGLLPYSESELFEVNYAVGIGAIYIAHNNHPIFRIKYENYDPDTETLSFSYGTLQLSGNIAYTPDLEIVNSAADDVLTAANVYSSLGGLSSNTTFNNVTHGVGGQIDGKTIKSVRKNVVSEPAYVEAYAKGWTNIKINDDYIIANSDPWSVSDRNSFCVKESPASPEISWPAGMFQTNYISESTARSVVLAAFAEKLVDNQEYYLLYNGWPKADGTIKYHKATNDISYLITFTDNSTKTITMGTNPMLGWIEVTSRGVRTSANTEIGTAAMDNVAPWMEPGVSYQCDSSTLFMGIYPAFAVKEEQAFIYDDVTGDLTEEKKACIIVSGFVDPADRSDLQTVIVDEDALVEGQLGVIINPFIGDARYPSFVAFHNGRMVVGGSRAEPNVLYMSKVNDYTNFSYFEEIEYEKNTVRAKDLWADHSIPEYDVSVATVQQINQDSAMRLKFLTEEAEAIQWAVSNGDLIIGTATSEWVIPKEVNAHNPIAILTSRNGSAPMQGRFVKGSVLFVSGNCKRIKMFDGVVGQTSEAISDQAEHLFREHGRILSIDFRQDPHHAIMATMDDGTAILGVFNGDVLGWCELATADSDSIDSVCVIQGYDEDEVYAIAVRGANRYIERMVTTNDDSDLVADIPYLDSYGSGTTVADGSISGYARMYGRSDVVIAFDDGSFGAPVIAVAGTSSTYVDANGNTQDNPASTGYVIGISYRSEITLLRIDSSSIEGLVKVPASFHMRVYRSGDITVERERAVDTDTFQVVTPLDEDGERLYPYTGELRIENPNGLGVDQLLTISIESHEPMTIQSITPEFGVGEES